MDSESNLDGLIEIIGCLADGISDGVLVFSADKVMAANSVCADLCALGQKELLTKKPIDLFEPEELARISSAVQATSRGLKDGVDFEITPRFSLRGSSSLRISTCKGFQFNGEMVTILLFQSADDPDQVPRQTRIPGEQVWQAQKMEAMGTLAGGVAHDMNNILAAIMSLASVLRQEADSTDPSVEDLDDILAATRRGRDLTQNLLGFARKGKYRKELISLNHVAVQVQDLLSRTIQKNVDWKLDLKVNIPSVRGDFGQLSHALMNIAINASDAMPDGGILFLKTSVITPSAARQETRANLQEKKYVALSVSDSGCGMDTETSARAFEPFFSTKDDNKGTGLGLAMVYGTAQNHGGEVVIDSREGEGTTVTVFLPTAKVKGVDKRTCPNLRAVRTIGTGRVLVVDDEELIRRSVKRVLETIGYTTVLASNGLEAVELFKENRDVVLVILDLTMPVMDGEEAFHKLKAIDDTVPVLLLSGHTLEGKAEELLDAGAAAFVQKPFDVQTLSKGILMSIPL